MKLNGKALPWVSSLSHLGSTITDDCRMHQDTLEKRAIYISRNNELNQEFYFSHLKTKVWANDRFNTCFYGSPLWEMVSRNYEKIEKSWNVSQRLMLSMPRTSHRFFIEPISQRPHIIKSLKQRFINFVLKIKNSRKKVLRHMLELVKDDCRSNTGRNIRHLKLVYNESQIEKIELNKVPYKTIPHDSTWKLTLTNEILAIKSGELLLENNNFKELDDILEVICTSWMFTKILVIHYLWLKYTWMIIIIAYNWLDSKTERCLVNKIYHYDVAHYEKSWITDGANWKFLVVAICWRLNPENSIRNIHRSHETYGSRRRKINQLVKRN